MEPKIYLVMMLVGSILAITAIRDMAQAQPERRRWRVLIGR